jgi:hypothetical protein
MLSIPHKDGTLLAKSAFLALKRWVKNIFDFYLLLHAELLVLYSHKRAQINLEPALTTEWWSYVGYAMYCLYCHRTVKHSSLNFSTVFSNQILSQYSEVGGFRIDVRLKITRAIPCVRKILSKLLRIEMENYSHHHDNGNVPNRTSMDIDLFNTYLSDKI